MKYLKTYEGIFDILRNQNLRELDHNLVKDLVASDLEGLNFQGYDILQNIEYTSIYYRCGGNGIPLLYKDFWYNRKIQYAKEPIMDVLGINKRERGLLLFENTNGLDSKGHFDFNYFIYSKINYQRMKDYNIGYCLFDKEHGVLFYSF